jgi:hypothetical protein
MCHDPVLVDLRTIFLLFVFSLSAFLLSPAFPFLGRKWQDRLALLAPLAIFAYWYFFQVQLVTLDQMHINYYHSMWGQSAWKFNTGICHAFGIAFSLQILRTPPLLRRIYGGLSLLLFSALMAAIESIKPV